MNKGIYVGLLGVVLLFSACGNATKNSINESSLTNSTPKVGSTKSTSTASITNTSTNNVDSQYSQSSIQSSTISSTSEMQERTEPSLPLENSDEALLFLIAIVPNYKVKISLLAFIKKSIKIICSRLLASRLVPKEDQEVSVSIEFPPME